MVIFQALATLKEKERELQQRETLIKALQTDRQQAFNTLKKHGIKVDKNVNVSIVFFYIMSLLLAFVWV